MKSHISNLRILNMIEHNMRKLKSYSSFLNEDNCYIRMKVNEKLLEPMKL